MFIAGYPTTVFHGYHMLKPCPGLPVMIPAAATLMSATFITPDLMSAAFISTTGITPVKVFMFKTFVVKATPVEIASIFSFKERTIVGIVETIPVVSFPGGVVIISVPGEFILIHNRSRCVLILVNR